MDFIAENLDRVELMHQGQIVMDAPVQHFYEQHELRKHYGIISPQITRLGVC